MARIIKFFQKRRKIIIGLVIIVVFIFGGYRLFVPKKYPEHYVVARNSIREELTLSGKIETDESVNLQFQTSGLLNWVGVKEGDKVKKYQTLALLDQKQIKKNLEKKLNDYMKTRWDFEQKKDDYKTGTLKGEQKYGFEVTNRAGFGGQLEEDILNDKVKRALEKAQFDLNNSVLDVELQNISLELSNLSTPIEGIVAKANFPYSGVNVISTDDIFEIVNPSTVYFKVTADQTEVVGLKEGQKGAIVFDSYPEEKIDGVIKNISFTPNKEETGTVYNIKVVLSTMDNSNYKYRIGMTGDIDFTLKEKEKVLLIPVNYVKTDERGKYVSVGKDRKKTYVKTGIENSKDVEITEGLLEGDIIYD